MNDIVKKLNEYLGFDYMDMYQSQTYNDYIYIYGGCLRDIISNNTINDVDIMCSTQAASNVIIPLLLEKGFSPNDKFNLDIADSYMGLNIIFKPLSFKKGNVEVQLIRPTNYIEASTNEYNPRDMLMRLVNLIGNVDLSCCGLYLNHNGLYETVNDAYLDCLTKQYRYNYDGSFYNDRRIHNRVTKIESKGFVEQRADDGSNTRNNIKTLLNIDDEYIAMPSPFIYTIIEPTFTGYDNLPF